MATLSWETGIILTIPTYPKTIAAYQAIIDSGDNDKLEEHLMELYDSHFENIEVFVPAYKTYVKRKEYERLLGLFQLHLDCLKNAKNQSGMVLVSKVMLSLWPECSLARTQIIAAIRTMYAKCPNLEKIIRLLQGLQCTGTDVLRQIERWARYDEGQLVYMPSKGVGRVKEINTTLGVVRIVFGEKDLLSCKIDEAERLLESLGSEHFLVQKTENNAHIVELAEKNPGEVLQLLFKSSKQTLSLAELKTMLSGVVSDAKWSSWWTRARKDTRLIVGSGTKPDISWNESSDAASAMLMAQFVAATIYGKLEMYHKYAARSDAFTHDILNLLLAEANAQSNKTPALALEFALDLENVVKTGTVALTFSVQDILAKTDAAAIVLDIKDRVLRRKAMTLVVACNDEWPQVYSRFLLEEQDVQTLTMVYDYLGSKGFEEIRRIAVCKALADPTSHSRFYFWICTELKVRPELAEYATGAFAISLLRNLDNKAFKGLHPALRKLFDLGESGDWVISKLDEADAARVLTELSHDNGLEEYRRDRLKSEIYHYHPHLQEQKIVLTYVTSDVLNVKREELQKIMQKDLPQNSLEIQRTREYGDLRENFEYHAARARQEMLSSRAKSLHDELNVTRSIDASTVDITKVSIGTRVTLKAVDETGESLTIMVLGPWDSDPSKNILSYTSATGTAMLGAVVGTTVSYNEKQYIVEAIAVWCR